MPYVLISTQIRLTAGPTGCGDQFSDPELMEKIGAELVQERGKPFGEYQCNKPPRIVLERLEKLGYLVVASAGVGQTMIWTVYKPDPGSDH